MTPMQLLTRLNITANSAIFFSNRSTYPANPEIGQLAYVDYILYIYTELEDGTRTWFPLMDSKDFPVFKHVQGVNSTTWTVNHELDSEDIVFFVYDNNDNLIQPDSFEFVDNNNLVLHFNEMIRGKCIIFSIESRFVHGVAGGGGVGGETGTEASIVQQFAQMNISSVIYVGDTDDIQTINYTTGNKKSFSYNANGLVSDALYYDDDGTTLLARQQLFYDGLNRLTSTSWTIY